MPRSSEFWIQSFASWPSFTTCQAMSPISPSQEMNRNFVVTRLRLDHSCEYTAAMSAAIEIPGVDHIGIRVRDLERAMKFYAMLGFSLNARAANDAVAIVRNAHGVELNLVYNANADAGGKNILMDVGEKYPGYTHVALRVASIKAAIEALRAHGVRITQGPVSFGADGHVSVFVRDPDLNVVELRGRDEDLSSIGGVVEYRPKN